MRVFIGIVFFSIMNAVFADVPKLKFSCDGELTVMVGDTRPFPLSIIISATELSDEQGKMVYVVNSSSDQFDRNAFGVGKGRFVNVDENFIKIGQRFQSKHNDLEIQEITLNRFSGAVEISERQINKGRKDSEQRYVGVCKLASKAMF